MKADIINEDPSYEGNLIDLSFFEKQERINVNYEKWNYFKIMNISNGKKYMAKVYKDKLEKFYKSMKLMLHREVVVNSKINHPSILNIQGYSLINFKNKPKPTIIFEYAANNSLSEHIYSSNYQHLNDTQKLIAIYGIASGMQYLHYHDLIHCILNPDYIFLDKNFYPKITGFHLMTNVIKNEPVKGTKLREPIYILAPEVLTKLEYSKSSDVYSFSLIMYQLLTNKKPFQDTVYKNKLIDDITNKGKRPKFEEPIKEAYKNLIERCWSQDPKLRPTFEEIVKELRTDVEFISDEINQEEYYKYINIIDQSTIDFDTTKDRKRKLDDILKSEPHEFYKIDTFMKLRRPNYIGNELDLTKYKLKLPIDIDNKDFIIHCLEKDNENKEKYIAYEYKKEINNFFKYELINFYRKLNIISQINHPAILNFIGFSPDNFLNKNQPVIVTEYWSNELQLQNLYDDDILWNDTKKLIIIYGIASAMSYLHSHDIIHRDLKLENIFLDENYLPKLFGFDISKEIKNRSGEKSTKTKGTAAYLAPEIYLNNEYSKSSDVYAFAFIIYEIFNKAQFLEKEKPFEELESTINIKKKVANDGKRPEFKIPIKESYKNLIKRCWSQDPKLRPTFDEILYELRTNQDFITDEIDKEEYFEYIKLLDEFVTTFEPAKRIRRYDVMISSKIHTFQDNESYISTNDIYETEHFNLSIESNYFNLDDYTLYCGETADRFFHLEYLKNEKTNDKITKKSLFTDINDLTPNEIFNFSRELKIISKLNHPSILKYLGYSFNTFQNKIPTLIFEYSFYGKLDTFNIYNPKIELDETKKLIILYGIASAMAYLHDHNIIHRNLKTSNILLDESFYPKLVGFNISKEIKDDSDEISTKTKGTPAYLAPEILLNRKYSKSSDIYAYSYIIYEIITGRKPFEKNISPLQIKKRIAEKGERPKFEEPIKEVYKNLIERCWSQDPKLRPTFAEIVKELRTDVEFISDEINQEEYYKYINIIDQSTISFDPKKQFMLIDFFIKS